MSYTQLTAEERYQISILMAVGLNKSDIADFLGRNKATIYREVRRNSGKRGYRPKQANDLAVERQAAKSPLRISQKTWDLVKGLIRKRWSPEQISGRLLLEQGISISFEWIYQYIYEDKNFFGGDLYTFLRCQKKRRKRYGSYNRRGCIPNQVSIDERPPAVDNKSRIGDWEGDTVIGKNHKGALVTLVERKSLYAVLSSVKNKTAYLVCNAITKSLLKLKDFVHTVTFDNGKEFALHETFAKALATDVYFAHPYSSWERGANENTNGLIRQYFPKNMNLQDVTQKQVEKVADWLNNRPRKSLGFKTPYEIFFKTQSLLTVALES